MFSIRVNCEDALQRLQCEYQHGVVNLPVAHLMNIFRSVYLSGRLFVILGARYLGILKVNDSKRSSDDHSMKRQFKEPHSEASQPRSGKICNQDLPRNSNLVEINIFLEAQILEKLKSGFPGRKIL